MKTPQDLYDYCISEMEKQRAFMEIAEAADGNKSGLRYNRCYGSMNVLKEIAFKLANEFGCKSTED